MDALFEKKMTELGLHTMDNSGATVDAAAGVIEGDLATPLCGAVAGIIDKLEAHSLAPAARAWLRGGEPDLAPWQGRDPTPLRWAQVDARLPLPFAERIVASATKRKKRGKEHIFHRQRPN